MSIKTWLVRGDCHGIFTWMKNGCLDEYNPEETAIIILGDAGINFWLNTKDTRLKKELESRGYYLYCVRGNHEERPQNIPSMQLIEDDSVQGEVYIEPEFPHIRYFKDYGLYIIDGLRVGVIGGAYSVDKRYRLMRAGVQDKFNPDYFNPKKTGWFPQEQLSIAEMEAAASLFVNQSVDFMFSHTCPIDWEPNDLFLGAINQSTVDKSMEIWLGELKNNLAWGIWCFGHFHADRLERPFVEQYYNNIENLWDIYQRWEEYKITQEVEWYLPKSPNFYSSLAF